MYAASLTCQSWTKGGLTMGFTDKQGVTAASVMLMLPCTVGAKLRSVCGTDWPATDGIMPMLFMAGGLLLHLAPPPPSAGAMTVIRVLGSLVFLCAFFIAGRWDVYSITAMALGVSALLAEAWRGTPGPPPPKHTNKHKA
jgi:hypothetical protein